MQNKLTLRILMYVSIALIGFGVWIYTNSLGSHKYEVEGNTKNVDTKIAKEINRDLKTGIGLMIGGGVLITALFLLIRRNQNN